MNKKGLTFKSAFFSVIAMSLMVIAIGIWVGEWNQSYGAGLDNDLVEYEYLDEMSSEASRQEGNVSVRSSTQGEDFEGTSIRAVFGILNNIYKPFRIIFGNNGMIDSVTDRFGVPDYIRQGLVTLMIISITFTLVAILFRLPRKEA